MHKHWLPVLIGYLIGSFFGLQVLLGLFSNLGAKPKPAGS